MTTTACDDQFSAEPEPVHQPYDVAAILRKNIADLEKELQRQREQNAAATERLRDEVNGLTGSVDQASAWQEAIEDIASYMSVGVEGCDPVEAVARIKKASDDFVRVAVQRAGRAEAALKEAQEQEPSAFWWIGPDGKDNGGPYRGKPSDFAIDNARNMGCEPILLYARPVPAAPAVAAPAVPEEWREVLRECADDLAIELDQRYGDSRKYPSEQRKYEAEMQPVYRARALLQSTGDQK